MISGGDYWHLLFGDDDRRTHVEFDINSLVVLKRILETGPRMTSQALDGFIGCVLYHRIYDKMKQRIIWGNKLPRMQKSTAIDPLEVQETQRSR
jgi:hypothetical protein